MQRTDSLLHAPASRVPPTMVIARRGWRQECCFSQTAKHSVVGSVALNTKECLIWHGVGLPAEPLQDPDCLYRHWTLSVDSDSVACCVRVHVLYVCVCVGLWGRWVRDGPVGRST